MVIARNKDQVSFWDDRHPSLGVPTGCLIVPREHIIKVKDVLSSEGKAGRGPWLRLYGTIPCPKDDNDDDSVYPYMIHLTIFGAAMMEMQPLHGIPPLVCEFLEKGIIQWKPGMRLTQQQQQHTDIRAIRSEEHTSQPNNASFRFCELFAGIGGFRVGLESLGGQCIFSSEMDPYASSTYQLNFGEAPTVGDITTVPTSDFPTNYDLLVGGFPCQSFSMAGCQKGLEDYITANGRLYLEVCRVLCATRPKAFLLENVANLFIMDGGTWHEDFQQRKPGNACNTILKAFRECGYTVKMSVVNSCHHGVPQYRERLFFVGFLDSHVADKFVWPLNDCDADGNEITITVRSILEPKDSAAVQAATLLPTQYKRVQEFLTPSAGRSSRAVRPDGIARTLMASYRSGFLKHSEFVVLNDHSARFYTGREAARIMGFPDSYIVPGCPTPVDGKAYNAYQRFYRQIGNAVCPPVVKAVAECILKAMGIHRHE
mmetsp:Transcript_31824/g.46826  ORF Transcript_31824/g.46826 Transcript_31824/m.46826 type:complete len:485 (+) Transcript_31824:33-1487(+)